MDFEKLEVWRRSARLSAELHKATRDFGFRDQITWSGLSAPSNIAEGMSRRSSKEKYRFLDIAKGSCAELRTQIYIGIDIDYLNRGMASRWLTETREIAAMLTGLMNKVTS